MRDPTQGPARRAATVAGATKAAIEAGASAGIRFREEPVLLPGVANTVLGFPRAGIVAKVATRRYAMARLPMEYALGVELAGLGAPVCRPVETGSPTRHGPTGFLVSLWHWVSHDPLAVASPEACASALATLHDALAATTTPVPDFLVELREARGVLDDDDFMAELAPGERTFLRVAYDEDLAALSAFEYPVRRLHGEAHEANRLVTPAGVVWVDLGSCCIGPREWDLAFLAPSAVARFGAVDDGLLVCLRRLNHARLATWRWGVLRDHPDLRPFAQDDLAFLKAK
jgi:hypothetical protein